MGRAAWVNKSGMGSMGDDESAVDLVLVTGRSEMNRIRDLIIAGTTTQIGDRAFIAELKHWLRFSPNAAIRKGDGCSAPPAAIRPCRSGWGPGCSIGSSP